MPLTPHEFKPEVSTIKAPFIWVSKLAHKKMSMYVDVCKYEIGWLGTATCLEAGETYRIDDVFLFKQKVGSAHTQSRPGAIVDLALTLTDEQNDDLRFWGHSHVRMGAQFSNVDFTNMTDVFGKRQDWYIGNVCNKQGVMNFYLFWPARGLYLNNVPWEVERDADDLTEHKKFQDEINSFCDVEVTSASSYNSKWLKGWERWKKEDKDEEDYGSTPQEVDYRGVVVPSKAQQGKKYNPLDATPGQVPTLIAGQEKFVEGGVEGTRYFIYNARGKWVSLGKEHRGWRLEITAKKLKKMKENVDTLVTSELTDKDKLGEKHNAN